MAKRKTEKKTKKRIKKVVIPSLWEKPYLYACLSVLVISAICLSPSLDNGFVNWDDDVNLLENPYTERLTIENIKHIFTTHTIGNYNPLSILTLAIERHFVGINDAYLYHFNNLLLHLICVLLVFRLMQLLKADLWVCIGVALLFGIHPMRVESVTWVTERKDVLFAVFYLGALCSYVRYVRLKGREKKFWHWAVLLFVPALLAKIQAVFLPLSMLAIDYYLKRPLRLKLVIEKWPFWLLAFITGLIGIYFLGEQGSLGGGNEAVSFGFGERLLIGAYSLLVYLAKWIYPYEMSPLYPYPEALSWPFYVAPVVVALVAGFTYWMHKKGEKAFVFGMAFFFFNIFMMLQILGAGQGFIADRFTYIPYIGLFFIMAHYMHSWWQKSKPALRTGIMVVSAAYMMLLGYTTYEQTKVWKDSEALWTHVIKYYDRNVTAWRNRGHNRRDMGDAEGAMADFKQAQKFAPNDPALNNSIGKSYFDQALKAGTRTFDPAIVQQAIQHYDVAIQYAPGKGEYWSNRGAAYGAISQYEKALDDLGKSLELAPDHLIAYFNRGILLAQQGRHQEALSDQTAYIQRNPNNAAMYHQRAISYRHVGNEQAALEDLNRAILIDGQQPLFYLERAKVNRRLGNIAASIQDAKRAKQLGAEVSPMLMQ